jgi:hypothetical protein
MPPNYFSDGAEVDLLQELIDEEFNGSTLRLFTSNHTPVQGDTLATYTAIEAAFGGYAAITLNSWGAAFTNAAHTAESDEVVRVFTATGAGLPVTIYGCFIKLNDGTLGYADLFQTPVTLAAAGQTVAYQAVITLETKP